MTDAKSLYKILIDKDVIKYLSDIPEYTGPEMAVDYITNKLNKKYKEKYFYDWAVAIKSDNKMIGRISVYRQDDERCMADLVWFLDARYRRHGYMSEAVKAVITHLQNVGLERIEAFADVENKASISVMKKSWHAIRRHFA